MPEYKLPDVGEGLIEAEIVEWKVAVGDEIAVNDPVVDIETAKSVVELPSPYAGTVTALLAEEGETVAVGTPIIVIGAADEVSADPPTAPAAGGSTQPIDTNVPPEGNPTLVGYGPREVLAQRRSRKGPAVPSTPAAEVVQVQVQDAFTPADEPPATRVTAPAARALAKPPVRRLAKDLGVDLADCAASGPDGTVTRSDVEAAAARTGRSAASGRTSRPDDASAGERETREPIKGVRKAMGAAMVQSAFTAPHVTEWVSVDVTRTMEFVERLRDRREFADVRVTPLLVLARAALLAMRRTPIVNSTWDEAAQEVVVKHYVNLGIAAATPRGLMVPNIKDAERLSLVELGAALDALIATARDGRTQPAEMSGGSFTITNVGVFGIDAGTPIINPGESAILCFGAVRKQPWVVRGTEEVVARDVTTLALSFDHRHIDGEAGSRFLADIATILEDPASALLF